MSDLDVQLVKFCSNCKRDIPIGNFVIHHVHCQRKLALCHICDEPVPLSEFAAHNANMHASVECPTCGASIEKRLLAEHQTATCTGRSICCSYCHIEIAASELAEHENYCGSRTEHCTECGEFVMLKYQRLHEDSNHGFLKLEDEPGPTPSWVQPSRASTFNLLNDLGSTRHRKVSNASQDGSRPTAAANRLSPSKRTNDMPQVNSAATPAAPKGVHKAVISSEECGVDLDRLLALRLAQQESPLPLSHPEPHADDLVALPCEFCEAMVPANQLVLHETRCRPDLTSLGMQPRPRHTTDPDNDKIPCEFCGVLFVPQRLLQHQALCDALPELLVNRFSGTRFAGLHGSKKLLNRAPSPPHRHPSPTDETEEVPCMPATSRLNHWTAPDSTSIAADLDLLQRHPSVTTGLTNGTSTTTSVRATGAVPKRKAGSRVGIRQVPEEVSRATATPITQQSPRRGPNMR